MKMIRATISQSEQMYKKKILEVNDDIIEALLQNDIPRIKTLRQVMSFMLDKYIKAKE